MSGTRGMPAGLNVERFWAVTRNILLRNQVFNMCNLRVAYFFSAFSAYLGELCVELIYKTNKRRETQRTDRK